MTPIPVVAELRALEERHEAALVLVARIDALLRFPPWTTAQQTLGRVEAALDAYLATLPEETLAHVQSLMVAEGNALRREVGNVP